MKQTDVRKKLTVVNCFGSSAALLLACGQRAVLFCLLFWSAAVPGSGATNGPSSHERGFVYRHDQVRDVPWSIHIVKVDRARTDLEFHTAMGGGSVLGMGLVSDQARSLPARLGRPVAAINGDFYRRGRYYGGDPEGLQIVDGELVSAPFPTRISLWIDAAGNPHRTNVVSNFAVTWPDGTTTPIGLNEDRGYDEAVLYTAVMGRSTRTSGGSEVILERKADKPWLPLRASQTYTAQVRQVRDVGNSPLSSDVMVLSIGRALPHPKVAPGDVLKISMATSPDLSGARTAIGGGPTLLHGGTAMSFSGFQMRHPRSAIGWNKDYIFLVEVDGRQRGLSIGMTLPELADYMLKLGCEEAMNFDGGGSATLWVMGNVMNSPSEGQERPAANSLVLVQKPALK